MDSLRLPFPQSACLPLLILFLCRLGVAQDEPGIAQLEWRNVVLQEQAAAFDAALAKGKHKEAATLAQKMIDGDLEPERRPDAADTDWPTWNLIPDENIEGLYHAPSYHFVRRLTGGLPQTLAAYRSVFAQRAQQAFDRAVRVGSAPDLLYLSRRFAATKAGLEAKEQAAHHALEEGRTAVAIRILTDLIDLDWQAGEDIMKRRHAALLLAHRLAGNRAALQRLTVSMGAAVETEIAGKPVPWSLLAATLSTGLQLPANGPSALAQKPGHEPGNGLSGKLKVLWSFPREQRDTGGIPSLTHPVYVESATGPARLIFHDDESVTAVSCADGEKLWTRSLSDPEASSAGLPVDEFFDDLRGATADGIYVAVRGLHDDDSRKSRRELVAVGTSDGEVLWRRCGDELGSRFPDLLFDGAPLLTHGCLYVTATTGRDDLASFVLAFEPRDGTLLWATKIGTGVALRYRSETGELAEEARWAGSLPLALVEGLLICCDNLGHITALEPEYGRPRFLVTYKRRKITSSGMQGLSALLRGWDRNPILAHGDRFLVAADDSDVLQAFFLRPPSDPGRRRANLNFLAATSIPRQNFTQLMGFDGENAVLAGKEPVSGMSIVRSTAVFVSPEPQEGWTFPTATNLLGRGYFGQKKVYFSTQKYVYGLDRGSGSDSGPMILRESDGRNFLGHVTLVPGGMIVASKTAVQRYGKSH